MINFHLFVLLNFSCMSVFWLQDSETRSLKNVCDMNVFDIRTEQTVQRLDRCCFDWSGKWADQK